MQIDREDFVLWCGWILVAVVACYLRFWEVGMQIVIDDEWHAINELKSSGYLDIFLSFGRADHSIPLTLYYKSLADTIGLTEWGLRLPSLVFGIATIFLVPGLVRQWITPWERLTCAALLAISPVLVHFSRTGRPYAITVVLCLAAVISFYHWWNNTDKRTGFAYVGCTALAAWLHPLTLVFTFGCLLWAGLPALQHSIRHKSLSQITRALKIALPTILICLILLLPPIINDYASLAAKAGVHSADFNTLIVAWQLLAGSGYAVVAWIAAGFAVYGGYELYKRTSRFSAYLMFIILIALLLIVLSGPEWIQHGRLLLRYMLPAVPLILLFIAIGVMGVTRRIAPEKYRQWAQAGAMTGAVIALYLAGPLPFIYQGINQFTGHQSYQFDYNYERNAYRQFLSVVEVPEAYYRIDRMAESNWSIIETPWRLESHFNPLYLYQRVHQLPIRIGFMSGLCSQPFYGEYGLGKEGLQFENFVHLREVLDSPEKNTFVIFHLKPAIPGMREIPDIEPCIDKFRARYGKPWYASDRIVVYRFS